MQRMISIPLQSTSKINIHVPIGELLAKQQQQQQQQPAQTRQNEELPGQHSRQHVTRMSVTSNGSSIISISPPDTPPNLSRSSSRNSPPPPPTFTKPQRVQHGRSSSSASSNMASDYTTNQQQLNGDTTNGNVQKMLNRTSSRDEAFETDSAMGSSQDDSRSIHSTSSNGERDAGFNSETSSNGMAADAENNNFGHCSVAIFMDKEMAVLIKATCQSEEACVDQRFVSVMLAIIKACGLHLKRNEQEDEFNAVTVNKMKLHDSRPAKEHLAELSRDLESSITIRDAIFRRFNEKSRDHVGTLVHDVVKADGNCTVARVGCMVEITKQSKFAEAREFANQLCEHIYRAKPRKLGNKDRALELQRLKTMYLQGQTVRLKIPKHELLAQTYIFDPTINVAEAARRSFVEVKSYVLYE